MIHAENVSVFFKRGIFGPPIKALEGFNVHINKGDIFALLGPNGAGKSTAMYTFLGLIKPTSGSITVFGETPEPGKRIYNRIAYLPEEPNYHLYLTVEEMVRFYSFLYRDDIPKTRVDEVIEKVGLQEFKNLKLSKCSKGMKQKAGIACCLIKPVDILFLDEPTRGLDPIIVKEFRDIIIQLNSEGTTVIINSHMLSEVEMVSNRTAIIHHGKVLREDSMENLLKLDEELYELDFDECKDPLPGYLDVVESTEGRVLAQTASKNLYEFHRFINEKGLKLYRCNLKRRTLEESFFDIVKGSK